MARSSAAKAPTTRSNVTELSRVPAASRKQKSKAGRKPPPPNETARDKFLRIGQARMQNAIHAIRLLGNLARATDYDYYESDVALMHATLTEAIDGSLSKFKPSEKKDIAFTFIHGPPAESG